MNHTDAIPALNRLCHLMLRSFPAYSVAVRSVTYRGPDEMFALLKQIASEQHALALRIAESIRDLRGAPEPGLFPIEFTSWNDIALPRVLQQALKHQQHLIAEAGAIAQKNTQAPVFHFAKEVLHLAERHAEMIALSLGAKTGTA